MQQVIPEIDSEQQSSLIINSQDKMNEILCNNNQNSSSEPFIRSKRKNCQFRALFSKNLSIQKNYIGTNICQIFTPLICLIFIMIIEKVISQIYPGTKQQMLFPVLFNLPQINSIIKNNSQFPIKISSCLQWYYYDFADNATINTKDFVELRNQTSKSYLLGNILNSYECENKNIDGIHTFNSPFFKKPKQNTLAVADGQLSLIDLISRAYMHILNEDVWIVSGIQYMPMIDEEKSFLMRIVNLSGATLYPIALSLLLPIFMYSIVKEKEEKIIEMMKMNGLKMKYYWLVNWLFNYCLYFITSWCFYLFGYFVLKLNFFTNTHITIIMLIFNGWGISLISLSFFYQIFIDKARSSTIIGYILSIWTILVAVSLNLGVYPDPYLLPLGLKFYPPFSFCRIIYLLSLACSNNECLTQFSQISDEIFQCIILMYLISMMLLPIAIYLHEIVPQEFGVRKHPLFFLKKLCQKQKQFQEQLLQIQTEFNQGNESVDVNEEQFVFEDMDCIEERKKVQDILSEKYNFPLICQNLRKIYRPADQEPNLALNNFSLAIQKGQLFGLLGPNGAGKSTLISIITGLSSPESGECWVSGNSIKQYLDLVQMNIGVCPQFDLLWEDLTVEEHLYFYGRIKGINEQNLKKETQKSLKDVKLIDLQKNLVKELSGGMKRRLSVAISMVGNPQLIILDEPTTGLDPKNRRQLWDILLESKEERAVFLTTHSMEEAEVLCNRIGILTNGRLRCIGNQTRLKTLYGSGYQLHINCHKHRYFREKFQKQGESFLQEVRDQLQLERLSDSTKDSTKDKNYKKDVQQLIDEIYKTLKKHIQNLIPQAELISDFNGNFHFLVPQKQLKISEIFENLEKIKEKYYIQDWGFSQSSLEDVFFQIVEKYSQN